MGRPIDNRSVRRGADREINRDINIYRQKRGRYATRLGERNIQIEREMKCRKD
jgi:hypothetical protein